MRDLADKETVIIFNLQDKSASVFTYDKRWQKHIEEKMGIKPNRIHGRVEHEGGRDYTVPKSSILMPQLRVQKKRASRKG